MVNIPKLRLTKLQEEILRLFYIKMGTSLNQRRIANILGVSQPAVMKALPDLEKKKFLKAKQDKDSKRWSIELNRDNSKVLELKRVDNLKQIYETEFVDFLESNFPGGVIVLFGSYSRGEDTINSDIDIAVIGRKEKSVNLAKYEKMLERTVNINFYDSFKSIHKHLKENLCNGIVLVGGFEL